MLPKLDGARRIRYKGDEMYLMLHRNALEVFPDTLISGEKPNDSFVIVSGGNGLNYEICATSNGLNEFDFTIEAEYPGNKKLPYRFPPMFVVMGDMILCKNEITEDDNLKYFENVENIPANILDFICISSTTYSRLHLLAILSILEKGISDYAEAIDDVYCEKRYYADWGTGEEGTTVSSGAYNEEHKPNKIMITHNKDFIINMAIKSPYWQNIPYIQLIAENRDFPE